MELKPILSHFKCLTNIVFAAIEIGTTKPDKMGTQSGRIYTCAISGASLSSIDLSMPSRTVQNVIPNTPIR
jgi:hypothetical protein